MYKNGEVQTGFPLFDSIYEIIIMQPCTHTPLIAKITISCYNNIKDKSFMA